MSRDHHPGFSRTTLAGFLVWVLVLGASLSTAFATERVWEKRFQLSPGGLVSVTNVQGSVVVQGWDRAEVEATVAIWSATPTDQIDDVQVAVETRSGAVTFHTLYPPGLDTPIRVDYRLRVPHRVLLSELSTLEGAIVVRDVDGTLKVHTLHGDIEGINVAGSVMARALTGNIVFSPRALPDRLRPFSLATVNGNIDFLMPPQSNANLEISTVAGKILVDYPFQVSATPGDSTRHAQVGGGGVRVELRTIRGNIRVTRRSAEV